MFETDVRNLGLLFKGDVSETIADHDDLACASLLGKILLFLVNTFGLDEIESDPRRNLRNVDVAVNEPW